MESVIYDKRLKRETIELFAVFDTYLTHACSLNIRQNINGSMINAETAWIQFENFSKNLNRIVYGHAGKKGKFCFGRLCDLRKHLHFHCAIGCADKNLSFDKLKTLISTAWRNQKLTYNNPYIVPYRDSGWIEYICKESVRLDLNSVDLTRCSIPASSQMK